MSGLSARGLRIAELVGAVARQLLADRRCTRYALLDDGGPEAELAAAWLVRELGQATVVRVIIGDVQLESVLQAVHGQPEHHSRARASTVVTDSAVEVRRLCARLIPNALVANASNKTALLLAGDVPPDPFFPLGDLYASEVAELAGGWSAPQQVRELAERAGGIGRLDAALRDRFDRRLPHALEKLGPAADAVHDALARGAAARVYSLVVPKVGPRTLGVDLFE